MSIYHFIITHFPLKNGLKVKVIFLFTRRVGWKLDGQALYTPLTVTIRKDWDSMPLFSLKEFYAYPFEDKGRFLGCDVGEKTIGLALSDVRKVIATPLFVLRRTKWAKDLVVLLEEIEKHQISGLVVGFPLNMNGTEGARCQSIRQFAANLLCAKDLPLCLWDERLSTCAVTRCLLEADISRARRRALVDKMAASYILQGFLEAYGKNLTE